MADTKQEVTNGSLVNGPPHPPDSRPQLNGAHSEPEPQPQMNNTDEGTQGGLGTILKGSAFEGSSPTLKANGIGAGEPPPSSTSQKSESTAVLKEDKSPDSMRPNKSIGSRIKDAVASNRNQPPPAVKLNTTKDAKPIKPPPTRQVPPAKISTTSPGSPRRPKTPKTPVSPKWEKPKSQGSATKATAEVAPSKKAVSPERAKKSPSLPQDTKQTSLKTRAESATRPAPTPPTTIAAKKSTSHEVKPRPHHVPVSTAAPTAASAAKTTNSTMLGRKPTVTRRDHPVKPSTTSVPATKKTGRTSLSAAANGSDKAPPRTSTVRKGPDEGFLARMMRPTASSAQKAHEKVAPSSPPQTKRAAPVHAAKGKSRSSLPTSDEDKENTHRGGPESDVPVPTTETREDADADRNADEDDGQADTVPLKDITPEVDHEGGTAESRSEAAETSTSTA